jgi:hypothetical protein
MGRRRWVCAVTAVSTGRSLAAMYIYVRKSAMEGSVVLSGRPTVSMRGIHISGDGVCARRVGYVLGCPFRDVLLVQSWHEVRQGFEGCLFILEAGAL